MHSRFKARQQSGSGGGRWSALLGGIGLGSALWYFVDPMLGRHRRARARDRAVRVAHVSGRGVMRIERDVSNRAHGILSRVHAALTPETPLDEVVKERVRSAIGRACSHAGAIEVSAANGEITLRGPILEREHDHLIRQVSRVRGVRTVDDRLERHTHPTNVPGLRDGGGHPSDSDTPALHCADVMKREIQTVREEDTVHRAAQKMTLGNIGFLVVCDETRKAIGTLTDRDITVRVVAKELSPATCRVGDVMTRQVVACRPDDELPLAEQVMAQHQVSRLVITDEIGVLMGVISLSDVAEREPARRAAATLRAVAAREAPRP
jgi:CBS domain-containing protein/osmotically-inducible protein OsmY